MISKEEKDKLIDSLYLLFEEQDLFTIEKINNITFKMKATLRSQLTKHNDYERNK